MENNNTLKRAFLFVTTILTATSTATGYGSPDLLKGSIDVTMFLDWFNSVEKHAHMKGLIVLDLIPAVFLLAQALFFFKDHKKTKGLFTVLALLANLVGVFLIIQYAHPIASQIGAWTPEKVPSDWIQLKDDWLKYVGLYSLTGILGWLCFVITYFVSERKNTAPKRLPRFANFSKNALMFFLTFLLGLSAARLYDFCFFPFQYEISGVTLIELHRPVDLAIRKVGPILFTFLISLELILAILFFIEKSNTKGWLIVAVIITLLCDTFIALQYNGPINDLLNSWTPTTIPPDWTIIRDKWLSYHLYRDVFMILGFSSILLVFFVKQDNNPTQAITS